MSFTKIDENNVPTPASTPKILENLSQEESTAVFQQLRNNFEANCTSKICDKGRWDCAYRKRNISGLIRLINENASKILEASSSDIGRSSGEWVLEKMAILGDLRLISKKLKKWMKPESRGTPLWMFPSRSYVKSEPYGVTLVLGAWNYNLTLSLLPFAGALAAGNACVLKPSELTPKQARLMAELLPLYVDSACFRVILGNAPFAAQLVNTIPWDFVFFTGSTKTGALVGESCAKRLIPCALELGGKSPTIIDLDCDLKVSCKRICQAKFVNCGQTCVAPDYLIILGDEKRKEIVLTALENELKNQYGHDAKTNKDFGFVVNEMHFNRLQGLLSQGRVVRGGKVDAEKRYIEPTIMDNVDENSSLMQDEIFGPILPILLIPDVKTCVEYIRSKPKPLALYLYSSNSKTIDYVLSKTTSGSACVNESVFQYLNPHLPFGGVGPSGTGGYHGKASFEEFSHQKSVMERGTMFDVKYRYFPFLGQPKVQKGFEFLMSL